MHWFFIAQILGAALAAGLVLGHLVTLHSLLTFGMLQGGLAALVSMLLRGPRWWLPLHFLFLPAIVIVNGLQVSPHWFLGAFILLLLLYWTSFRSRIPLFLTNQATLEALRTLVMNEKAQRIMDAGCGTGTVLRSLALAYPDQQLEGWEIAPLPWAIAWARTRRLSNCRLHRASFWPVSWREADLVYVFLSPVPMQRVWSKALAEMRPGCLLVSNSFEVPNTLPERVISLDDRRRTRLFLYRIPYC